MPHQNGLRVIASCPEWPSRGTGMIIHSFQGLHYGSYYRVQPDDRNLPIGSATSEQVTPIQEQQPMTSQTYRVGDFVECFLAWLPGHQPTILELKEIDPDHAPRTHAVMLGDRYSWLEPSDLGRVIVPSSGRVVGQTLPASAPKLFPISGESNE